MPRGASGGTNVLPSSASGGASDASGAMSAKTAMTEAGNFRVTIPD